MAVVYNDLDTSAVQKLADYGERTIPLDGVACSVCDRLFSEEGLVYKGMVVKWEFGSRRWVMVGTVVQPVTLQAHNQCLAKARGRFAKQVGDPVRGPRFACPLRQPGCGRGPWIILLLGAIG